MTTLGHPKIELCVIYKNLVVFIYLSKKKKNSSVGKRTNAEPQGLEDRFLILWRLISELIEKCLELFFLLKLIQQLMWKQIKVGLKWIKKALGFRIPDLVVTMSKLLIKIEQLQLHHKIVAKVRVRSTGTRGLYSIGLKLISISIQGRDSNFGLEFLKIGKQKRVVL